jgi:Flp pilus assembly protein CpaB
LQTQSGPSKRGDLFSIPPDMRAVTVDVTSLSAAGFVAPGMRVDVLATGNFSGSNEPRYVTILRNVKVIASGRRLDHGSLAAHVVTLVVSPEDAEKLALATQEGHQLTLRNPVDTKQETTPPRKNLYVPLKTHYATSARDSQHEGWLEGRMLLLCSDPGAVATALQLQPGRNRCDWTNALIPKLSLSPTAPDPSRPTTASGFGR